MPANLFKSDHRWSINAMLLKLKDTAYFLGNNTLEEADTESLG